MRNFLTILETITNDEIVNEAGAGASRIVSHINAGKPFILLSAERDTLSPEENDKRTEALKRAIEKNPALSYIETTGEFEGSFEKSFFILQRSNNNSKNFVSFGKKLGAMFDQKAIIYGDGSQVYMWERAEDSTFPIGDAASFSLKNITKMGNGWTIVKGAKFAFGDKDEYDSALKYGNKNDYSNKPSEELPIRNLADRERKIG